LGGYAKKTTDFALKLSIFTDAKISRNTEFKKNSKKQKISLDKVCVCCDNSYMESWA
jgi:hypothetical protein